MKKFVKILAWICIGTAILAMPVVMYVLMNGGAAQVEVRDTGGNQPEATVEAVFPSVGTPDTGVTSAVEVQMVNVTADMLEIRSEPNGKSLGYWQKGASIEALEACMDGSDMWIRSVGGWSAALFAGRQFISPLPEAGKRCGDVFSSSLVGKQPK